MELSLFSGAGGGLLGSKLLGWKCVGYVENDDYCQKVLRARIRDGYLDDAPIFADVRTFDGRPYCGRVDIVTAGFPCQPFSIAGKRKGQNDERNMWPEVKRIANEVQPEFLFCENVPALLTSDYFGVILRDLQEIGFFLERPPTLMGAMHLGAPHQRLRLWFLARNSNSDRLSKEVASSTREEVSDHRQSVWWESELGVSRVDDGASDWMDRTKTIGNMQVPAVVRAAWEELTRGKGGQER